MDKQKECAKVVKDIKELKDERDPNGSVWQLTLFNYKFPFVEANKQLNEIKANYEKAIASAPKHTIEYKSKFYEKLNELIEEKKEESPSVIQLSNINKLSDGFKDVSIEYGDEIKDEPSNIQQKNCQYKTNSTKTKMNDKSLINV